MQIKAVVIDCSNQPLECRKLKDSIRLATCQQPRWQWDNRWGCEMPQPLWKPIGNILQISIQPASLLPYHTKRNESMYPCSNPYQVALATFITIAQAGNNLSSKLWHVYTVGIATQDSEEQTVDACLQSLTRISNNYSEWKKLDIRGMACNHIYAEFYEIQSDFCDWKQTRVSWMRGAWEYRVGMCSLACVVTQQVTGYDCQSADTNMYTF